VTKDEAVSAMVRGEKVTHVNFSPEEYVSITHDHMYLFEDGVRCTPLEFWTHRMEESWSNGWSIYKTPNDEGGE
jgi:hypothetical protein